ncbi:MAG: hypothetical protein R2729_33030 [Bryobacteraceae bacterium]
MRLLAVAKATVVLLAAEIVSAATVTVPFGDHGLSGEGGTTTGIVTVGGFGSTGVVGTLVSVRIEASGGASAGFSLFNDTLVEQSVLVRHHVDLFVGAVLLWGFGEGAGVVVAPGEQGSAASASTQQSNVLVTDPRQVSLFAGREVMVEKYWRREVETAGLLGAGEVEYAVSGEFVYEYEQVPEPAPWAAVAMGLAAVRACRSYVKG